MEDDMKQKGGKKLEQNTTIVIPKDIYLDCCTPDEQEPLPKRKIRLQKIEHRLAKEWKEYRFVTPKYAEKFALKPPGKRPPLEDHQKKAEAAVRKFNEESAAAAAATSCAAETSSTTIPLVRPMPQKSKASKPQEKLLQKAMPAPTSKLSTATQTSKPAPKQIVKYQPAHSSSSVPSATSSETKSSPITLKTKMTAGRGIRPSPSKVIKVPSASEGSDEYDDETLQAIIRDNQERVAQGSCSAIPLAMDPKVLLDFINVWYDDPNTPIDDLKLPPDISHMVATFINEAKWKEMQAKQAKAAKLKKEKFLTQNLLNLTPDALVSTQVELKTLIDEYTKLSDCQSLKTNFIKFATNAIGEYNKKVAPPAKPQQPKHPADAPVIEEIAKDIPADESVPADESAPAEENASVDETARTNVPAPDEKISSPKSSKAKRQKTLDENGPLDVVPLNIAPLDVVPLNIAPSYTMSPFVIDYVIPKEDEEIHVDEEMKDADSEETMDEEIQIDDIHLSSVPHKMPDETAQGSTATTEEFGSSSKQTPQAEENQEEDPQPEENPNPEQDPQPEVQAKENSHPEQNP
ncbi:hypothetical protein ZWY2020_008229 [Hordeum vulgare]|nr:hypothetical protein ZWY2020_008229 [Hordeum vulgare]